MIMKSTGAILEGNDCLFTVWAPLKDKMLLHLVGAEERAIPMEKDEEGYFDVRVKNIGAGTRYFFRPDDTEDLPDPASHYQPEGVHGPSEVVDHSAFEWTDHSWNVPEFSKLVLYELHVGTFTSEGTFDAIIEKLDHLIDIGVNAIELMPVGQFPGTRNWGYDGVYPYAVQNSYGGADGLKRLVNACHAKGIAVFLDVVYNHLGPEGNYLTKFGPYFTKSYTTPWGEALNFDNDWSDGVRDFFAGNVLYWFEKFHIDGLRCDAIHMVFDHSAIHFWEYVHQHVRQLEQQLGRTFYLVAESDLNSPKVVTDPNNGGYGFDAQWLDDFHHALYTVVDKQGKDRYEDFGELSQLAKGYTDGFVLSGDWVKFRKRRYGRSSAGVPGDRFVVFNQNHDQVGNRVKGERLCMLVDAERLKLAAAAILLAPYVPMLFMGEEYADDTPFYYFISHSDPELIKAVQEGRKNEFARFGFDAGPPDPQDEKTFNDSKLKWQKRSGGRHRVLLDWHRQLISMRKTVPALQNFSKGSLRVDVSEGSLLVMHRQSEDGRQAVACVFNYSDKETVCTLADDEATWVKLLDSGEPEWLTNDQHRGNLPAEFTGKSFDMPPLTVAVFERVTY
jgi:maltooligosyltrehalose trehalohydrolase